MSESNISVAVITKHEIVNYMWRVHSCKNGMVLESVCCCLSMGRDSSLIEPADVLTSCAIAPYIHIWIYTHILAPARRPIYLHICNCICTSRIYFLLGDFSWKSMNTCCSVV